MPVDALSAEKEVVGWIENVYVFPGNLKIKAKLDTGAENCSIHAAQICEFRHKGHDWVRFELTDSQGRTENFETKVIRKAKIKRKGLRSQERPIVRIGVCLGTVYKEVDVNLVNRSNFDYNMLVGRSFLQGSFVVDSDQTLTVKQKCSGLPNH